MKLFARIELLPSNVGNNSFGAANTSFERRLRSDQKISGQHRELRKDEVFDLQRLTQTLAHLTNAPTKVTGLLFLLATQSGELLQSRPEIVFVR